MIFSAFVQYIAAARPNATQKKKSLPVLQPKATNITPKWISKHLEPQPHFFCLPTSQPLFWQPSKKPWLLPFWHLADHLLGTLAGLSSTRVSRRSCWNKNPMECMARVGKLWISQKMKQEYQLCWNDILGANLKTQISTVWSWWLNNDFHISDILKECPC